MPKKSDPSTGTQRRLNVFPETRPHPERLNPHSIRRLIYDVIRSDFDGNVNQAAETFEKVRKEHKGRGYRTNVTTEAYYRIVHDRQSAKYMHLEAIAIYLQVPVGLLLLYTRITAEQNEDREPHLRVQGILSALAKIVEQASKKAEGSETMNGLFQYHDLRVWIELFKDRPRPSGGPDQLDQQIPDKPLG